MRAMLRGTRHLLSAVLLIGVPTLLVHVGGAVPAPHRAEIRDWLHDPLADPRLLFFGLLAAGWLLWLLITLAVLQRLARRSPLRAVRQCALRLPGPLQGLTATILGAAAITSTASGLATSAPIPPATTAAPDITADQLQLTAHVVQHTDPSPGTRPHTVTVRRGDSLWTLADRWLGDPHRWRQIYRVNAARYDRHGHMDGGNHIESGWSLTLPRAAKAPRDSPHTGRAPPRRRYQPATSRHPRRQLPPAHPRTRRRRASASHRAAPPRPRRHQRRPRR
jgi:hypothetical protein